jgi:hypothetical protein
VRILAFSDVVKWRYDFFKGLVDQLNPNLIALAGDLAFDGFAPFYWRDSFCDEIPKGRKFESLRKTHVKGFYDFLVYAGGKSKVLLVKGNHDDEFEGEYSPQKINGILGCVEISGKIIEWSGYSFLGLGYNDAHNRRKLIRMSEELTGKVDIVLMHGENIRLVSLLKPRLIIKGGLTLEARLVNDVPAVFTGPESYAVIELKNRNISKILGYQFNSSNWVAKHLTYTDKKTPRLRTYRPWEVRLCFKNLYH